MYGIMLMLMRKWLRNKHMVVLALSFVSSKPEKIGHSCVDVWEVFLKTLVLMDYSVKHWHDFNFEQTQLHKMP